MNRPQQWVRADQAPPMHGVFPPGFKAAGPGYAAAPLHSSLVQPHNYAFTGHAPPLPPPRTRPPHAGSVAPILPCPVPKFQYYHLTAGQNAMLAGQAEYYYQAGMQHPDVEEDSGSSQHVPATWHEYRSDIGPGHQVGDWNAAGELPKGQDVGNHIPQPNPGAGPESRPEKPPLGFQDAHTAYWGLGVNVLDYEHWQAAAHQQLQPPLGPATLAGNGVRPNYSQQVPGGSVASTLASVLAPAPQLQELHSSSTSRQPWLAATLFGKGVENHSQAPVISLQSQSPCISEEPSDSNSAPRRPSTASNPSAPIMPRVIKSKSTTHGRVPTTSSSVAIPPIPDQSLGGEVNGEEEAILAQELEYLSLSPKSHQSLECSEEFKGLALELKQATQEDLRERIHQLNLTFQLLASNDSEGANEEDRAVVKRKMFGLMKLLKQLEGDPLSTADCGIVDSSTM